MTEHDDKPQIIFLEPGAPVVTLGTGRPAHVVSHYPREGETLIEWDDDHERARFTKRWLAPIEPEGER